MIKKRSEITSEEELTWAGMVQVQRAQKVIVEKIKDNIDFNNVKRSEQKNNTFDRPKLIRRDTTINCKYRGNSHVSRRYSVYGT